MTGDLRYDSICVWVAANRRATRRAVRGDFSSRLLCVLLVVVTGTVQVAHTHADGADTHADCSLCAVAHITVHLAQTPAPAPPAQLSPCCKPPAGPFSPSHFRRLPSSPGPRPVAAVPA